MKIIVAEPTGLCFGVKRAISAVENALASGDPVYAIGSPIHNPQEVARLESLGLKVVKSEKEVPEGAVAFIRAHGAAPSVFEELKAKNATIIDGTCPFVQMVQRRAKELSDSGYHLLIFGNEKHPEIQGILGYVSGSWTVFSSVSSLFSSTIFKSSDRIRRLGLVSQTTQEETLFAEAAKAAVNLASDLKVYDTICRATTYRQQAVRQLASKVDGLIIIGGHDSANTGKLYHIAAASGCDVIWIEHAGELDSSWVVQKGTVGIAAGASTPDWLIEKLIKAIHQIAGCQGDVSYE